MTVKSVPVAKLIPYEKNAKKHPAEQVRSIANSIKEFGWQQPIVADNEGVIIIGHGRYAAALMLGYDEVPVVYADDLTEEQIKALRLVDNKVNESEWNYELLKKEIEKIGLDMSEFGFSLSFGDEDEIDVSSDIQADSVCCPRCGFEWEG